MSVYIPLLTREQRNELRRQQVDAKKAAILRRCRELMADGNFRPSAIDICGTDARHDVTNLFVTLPRLHEMALDDDTVRAIARVVNGDGDGHIHDLHRLARAVVFGRLSS